MGRYYTYIDYTEVLNGLKADFHRQCLEIQLVWLAEMLLLYCYLNVIRDVDCTIKHINNYDIFSPPNAATVLNRLRKPTLVYRKLSNFRNTYVHAGSTAAFSMFCELYINYQVELMELAQIVGVNINFNCALYKILEKRTIN